MTETRFLCKTNKYGITTTFAVVVMLLLFMASCGKENKEVVEVTFDPENTYTLRTTDVSSLISDSGITRYRINTEEWLVFDRKNPPYWAFEKGVYLEKFDSVFNVEASVKADTAYYYEKQKLWKLMSNVDIQNLKGERFETDLLYWDQNKHTIYSDQFIRIEQPDRIITGHGFDSNEQMTIYTIRKPEGIFYVDDDATAPADSLQTDSVQTGSVRTDSIKP